MANTLTPLIPFVVASFQRVLRQSGAVFNMVNTGISAEVAAKDQTINIPKAAAGNPYEISPGANPPSLVDKTVANGTLVLDQYRGDRFHITEEDWKGMASAGTDFRLTQVESLISGLVNEAATHINGKVADAGSYAAGTPGTSPFASDADVLADLAFFLDELQAPAGDRGLLLDPRSFRDLFKLDSFQRLNEAPEGVSFASGQVRDLQGMLVGWDQSIQSHTAGAGTGYQTNGAVSVGDTTIAVDTGSGTILPGDIISFAGGNYKYVVLSEAAGTITLAAPVLEAISDNVAMTIEGGKRNFACHRDAIYWAARPPAEVPGGDAAESVEIVTDPISGLSMRLAEYGGYHARQYELSILYGCSVVRPELLVPLAS